MAGESSSQDSGEWSTVDTTIEKKLEIDWKKPEECLPQYSYPFGGYKMHFKRGEIRDSAISATFVSF